MPDALPPGSVIGILGGGQLGRMLALAAARLGLRCHIYEPGSTPPAAQVSETVTTADWNDLDELSTFANAFDVITYEFENIPTTTLDHLEKLVPIRPGRAALAASQDRIMEKDFLTGLGLQVTPYRAIDSLADLKQACVDIGTPAILKTRRFGYDGKGQSRLRSSDDASAAFDALKGAPAVLERFVDFQREVSVIAARGLDGAVACFDPGENVHRDGILHTTTVPADLNPAQRTDAVLLAAKILNGLEYVGVLGVELFVTAQGLIVNEIAPRVHNSGHWTQNACLVDQFEQHIRAVCGWPLADGTRHSDAVMTNLIGEDADTWADVSDGLHLYGKAETREGRKMGHINRISPKS